MNSDGAGTGNDTEKPWVLHWAPVDSPPTTEDDVLVVVRDKDGRLFYCIGRHYLETEPIEEEELDGKPLWCVTDELFWTEESLVRWSALPPIL